MMIAYSVRSSVRTISRILCITVFLCVLGLHVSAQNTWPIPAVALYDCSIAGAGAGTTGERTALASASKEILKNIPIDTTGMDVFIITHGFADTTAAGMPLGGTTLSFPDTGRNTEVVYDYVIAGAIVGKAGAYTLTVSILDGHTYARVADGTAVFTAATEAAVAAACKTAMQQILPLAAKIRAYLTSLKTANPLLTINPVIDILPAAVNPPLNGKTDVAITATDCDGLPIANRQLLLEATRGSFAASTIQTDKNGKAAVVFNAGKVPGISALTATLLNAMSAVHDTMPSRGSTSVIIGDADKKKLWVMDFTLGRSFSSYNDKLIRETEGTRWRQKNAFWVQGARGRFIGTSDNDENTEFSFNDSTLGLSGSYFSHNFEKETYTDITGKKCPQTDWEMGGSTWSYTAEPNSEGGGEADFEYDPLGSHLFHISVPFTNKDAYGYNWSNSGTWDNGKCVTEMLHRGAHFKLYMNLAGGVTYYGKPPVEGLTIVPWSSSGTITGYSVSVNGSYTGHASDGSVTYLLVRCNATITPLDKVTSTGKTEPVSTFTLGQNYPNPFNPSTRITFSVPSRSFVSLKVFDVMGREVASLVSGELAPGSHSRQWNASAVASGIYFYRLQAGPNMATKKLLLLR